jgi:hypothetical protein
VRKVRLLTLAFLVLVAMGTRITIRSTASARVGGHLGRLSHTPSKLSQALEHTCFDEKAVLPDRIHLAGDSFRFLLTPSEQRASPLPCRSIVWARPPPAASV